MDYLKKQAPRLLVIILLAVCVGYLWTATSIPLDFWSESERFNARSMPYLAGGAALIVGALLLVWPGSSPDLNAYDLALPRPGSKALSGLLLVGLMFTYPLGLTWLGFPLATALFLTTAFRIMGETPVVLGGLVASALAATFWLIMNQLDIHLEVAPWLLRGPAGA